MKAKALFLLKGAVYSMALFVLWRPLLSAYLTLMNKAVPLSADAAQTLYTLSQTMIPFAALLLATPRVSRPRKAMFILACLAVSVVMDVLAVTTVFAGLPEAGESYVPLGQEIYIFLKWLVPFLFWVIPAYPYLEQFFALSSPAEQ